MATNRNGNQVPRELLAQLLAQDNEMPAAERLQMMADIRQVHADGGISLDRTLLEIIDQRTHASQQQRQNVHEAEQKLVELEQLCAQVFQPPFVPARLLGTMPLPEGPGAIVHLQQGLRLVPIAPDVALDTLQIGDVVLLNADMTTVVNVGPALDLGTGATAMVEDVREDGRVLIRRSDEQILLRRSGTLDGEPLKHGDIVRFDPPTHIAMEKVDRRESSEFQLQRVDDLPLTSIGGQWRNLREMITNLTLAVDHPEIAARYQLDSAHKHGVLLIGPPGTGKTLMARIAASHVQRMTGRTAYIMEVKPGQFEDPYVGVAQQRIRECFKALRSCDGFALLFLDEIESIGRIRGGANAHISDKFLGALLAEMEGFATDSPGRIAIVAATNRVDLLDPALVERFETQLHIRRPDRDAAREIFQIHLPAELPYHVNGVPAEQTRQNMIDCAISSIYAPNGNNQVCTVHFADARERTVTASDLASGRTIQQLCLSARRAACVRDLEDGVHADSGLRPNDIAVAFEAMLQKFIGNVSRENIRSIIDDLPQDVAITAVQPAPSPVTRPSQYRVTA